MIRRNPPKSSPPATSTPAPAVEGPDVAARLERLRLARDSYTSLRKPGSPEARDATDAGFAAKPALRALSKIVKRHEGGD